MLLFNILQTYNGIWIVYGLLYSLAPTDKSDSCRDLYKNGLCKPTDEKIITDLIIRYYVVIIPVSVWHQIRLHCQPLMIVSFTRLG